MNDREKLARMLCEKHNINPDQKTTGLGSRMEKSREYFLWEYQAENYVDPLLEELQRIN